MPSADVANRPGFCSACFCERCMRGFYTAAKSAIKVKDGKFTCAEPRCAGVVRGAPTLGFQRIAPCTDGCARLKQPKA